MQFYNIIKEETQFLILSSTRALRDVTEKMGGSYSAAVGEVNVVTMMKSTNAIIGGEGNGGVILPEITLW
jgi:phosphomannomutase